MNNKLDIKPLFSPSLMCLDYLDIKNQIGILNQCCDLLHADIMDGHFAKNITLSFDLIRAIKSISELPIDAHLMVTNPNDFIDQLFDIGVDTISLHAETIQKDSYRIIRKIKDHGCKFGVVICPATPLSLVKWYLDQVDLLTIMTVEIGYAGQKFIPQMLGKIAEAKDLLLENDYHYIIQIDGAIGRQVYKPLFDNGARAFVMGTSGLFKPGVELSEACQLMKKEFSDETGVIL